jgi:hypothetical protein
LWIKGKEKKKGASSNDVNDEYVVVIGVGLELSPLAVGID